MHKKYDIAKFSYIANDLDLYRKLNEILKGFLN
jgi:hypothetical protein